MSYINQTQRLVNEYNRSPELFVRSWAQKIYHYTSPDGMNGIVKNHTLRFTDRNYLNDYSEGRYVLQLCLSNIKHLVIPSQWRDYFIQYCNIILDKKSGKKFNVYQCSFSTNNDCLPLWNYYSKNDEHHGYNIGFKPDDISEKLNTSSYNNESMQKIKLFHGRVEYSTRKQLCIIQRIIDGFIPIINDNTLSNELCVLIIQLIIQKILTVGAFFKSPYFKSEEEYRFVIHLLIRDKNGIPEFYILNKEPCYDLRYGMPIPYVDIEFDKAALKTVFVSPTYNFTEEKNEVFNLLQNNAYPQIKKIKIFPSKIPVRY